MMVKIEPGTQVNTIHLIRYQKLFPHKISESRYPKPGTLIPTSHSWMSHNGKPQPFLGHFIAKVNHATEPMWYPIDFYVFEDATSPKILVFYVISECLGILEFNVPNFMAQLHIDALTVPTSPNPGSLRETAKCITFQDLLIDTDQPHHTFPPCGSSPSGLRKTAKTVQFKDPIDNVINGTSCKGPSMSNTKLPLSALKAHNPVHLPQSQNQPSNP